MLASYADIRDRIATPPLWFDESGVPRYEPFHPELSANIYADEVALVEIACQACEQTFHVAISSTLSERLMRQVTQALDGLPASLAERIADKSLGYGDPPNVGCCPAGPTMSSDTIRVLEYWHFPNGLGGGWAREASAEVAFDPPEKWCERCGGTGEVSTGATTAERCAGCSGSGMVPA